MYQMTETCVNWHCCVAAIREYKATTQSGPNDKNKGNRQKGVYRFLLVRGPKCPKFNYDALVTHPWPKQSTDTMFLLSFGKKIGLTAPRAARYNSMPLLFHIWGYAPNTY